MLYSKNGSIPKPETDGTDGWIEVPEPPAVPAGKELVWWCPPGWVVRDLKPAETETTDFSWSQTEERWVEYTKPVAEQIQSSENIVIEQGLSSIADISMATASETTILE